MTKSILTIGALICLALMFNLMAARHAIAAPDWPAKECGPIEIGGIPTTIQCEVTYTDCAEYHPVHPPMGEGTSCDGPDRTRWCMLVCAAGGEVIDLACVCDCTDATERPKHEYCVSEN